jgi:hypothetical protein
MIIDGPFCCNVTWGMNKTSYFFHARKGISHLAFKDIEICSPDNSFNVSALFGPVEKNVSMRF